MSAGVLTGVNFRKWFLFLIVLLLEPKVITLNCLCSVSACIHDPTLTSLFRMVSEETLNEGKVTDLHKWQLLGLLAQPVMELY